MSHVSGNCSASYTKALVPVLSFSVLHHKGRWCIPKENAYLLISTSKMQSLQIPPICFNPKSITDASEIYDVLVAYVKDCKPPNLSDQLELIKKLHKQRASFRRLNTTEMESTLTDLLSYYADVSSLIDQIPWQGTTLCKRLAREGTSWHSTKPHRPIPNLSLDLLMCVYNAGCIYSCMAFNESASTEASAKARSGYYLRSAYFFEKGVKIIYNYSGLLSDLPNDFSANTLGALALFMRAQGFECLAFNQLGRLPVDSPESLANNPLQGLIERLLAEASRIYKQCGTCLTGQVVPAIMDVRSISRFKADYLPICARFLHATALKTDSDNSDLLAEGLQMHEVLMNVNCEITQAVTQCENLAESSVFKGAEKSASTPQLRTVLEILYNKAVRMQLDVKAYRPAGRPIPLEGLTPAESERILARVNDYGKPLPDPVPSIFSTLIDSVYRSVGTEALAMVKNSFDTFISGYSGKARPTSSFSSPEEEQMFWSDVHNLSLSASKTTSSVAQLESELADLAGAVRPIGDINALYADFEAIILNDKTPHCTGRIEKLMKGYESLREVDSTNQKKFPGRWESAPLQATLATDVARVEEFSSKLKQSILANDYVKTQYGKYKREMTLAAEHAASSSEAVEAVPAVLADETPERKEFLQLLETIQHQLADRLQPKNMYNDVAATVKESLTADSIAVEAMHVCMNKTRGKEFVDFCAAQTEGLRKQFLSRSAEIDAALDAEDEALAKSIAAYAALRKTVVKPSVVAEQAPTDAARSDRLNSLILGSKKILEVNRFIEAGRDFFNKLAPRLDTRVSELRELTSSYNKEVQDQWSNGSDPSYVFKISVK